MSSAPGSAGDAVSSAFKVIEVRVAELRQLFNAIDPRRSESATSTHVQRNSLSSGPAIYPAMHH